MNKKIVIVTRAMTAGGAERVIAQLANYFVGKDIECTIITTNVSPIEYSLNDNVQVQMIGEASSNKAVDRVERYGNLRKRVLAIKPDVILTMPEDTGIYVILAMLGTGIPVYVSERNNPWVMPDVKVTRTLRKIAYHFAKGIIFQTETAMSFFPESVQKKGIVLDNPIEADRIPEPYKGERRKIIVGAGRLNTQKNFPLLINSFAAFARSHPDYRLVIYGNGKLKEELEELAKSLGIAEKVNFPGRSDDLLIQIRDAAMFVLSSDYEGMPNVLLEAMCCGMPVIATDCPSGGPKKLIADGENGLLVPVGDKEKMAEAMEKLADTEYAAGLGDNAYQIKEKLTDVKIFEEWYEYLLG